MAKARSHPFRGFLDMFTEMERMRQLGRTGGYPGHAERSREHPGAWVPTADIVAVGSDLVVRLELPGVDPTAVEITLAAGVMTISGENHDDLPADAQSYARERHHGAFSRSMILPDDIDEAMISASYADGIVEITVAGGARSTESSRIPIQDRAGRRTTPVRARRVERGAGR